jgi:hypothetical protein
MTGARRHREEPRSGDAAIQGPWGAGGHRIYPLEFLGTAAGTPGSPRRCAPRHDGAPSAVHRESRDSNPKGRFPVNCGEFLPIANLLAEKHKSCHSPFVRTDAIDNARKTRAAGAADRRGLAYHSNRLTFIKVKEATKKKRPNGLGRRRKSLKRLDSDNLAGPGKISRERAKKGFCQGIKNNCILCLTQAFPVATRQSSRPPHSAQEPS